MKCAKFLAGNMKLCHYNMKNTPILVNDMWFARTFDIKDMAVQQYGA